MRSIDESLKDIFLECEMHDRGSDCSCYFDSEKAIPLIKQVFEDARHSVDPRCVHYDQPGLCDCGAAKEVFGG